MKIFLILILCILLFANCTHRIYRYGYINENKQHILCKPLILKSTPISDSLATKVGDIVIDDNGLSIICSEQKALDILIDEACAIKADIIVITEEKKPDLWSTCYRCRAEFFRSKKWK